VNTAKKAPPLPCILLVEDSATTATVLSRYLVEQYRLVRAADGEEAWSLLQQRVDIELVITDIQMPRLTGHQLLVRLRRSDVAHLRSLPVIVMTTGDDTADRNLAFLNGASDFITKPIDELELQARVKVHYSLAHTIRELEDSRRLLEEQATTDPLTHLKNRRAFFEAGSKALSTARRYNGDLSVIIVDIDFFKRINDTHGHHAGDEALVAVAQLLGGMIRAEDTCARIGGEEFALLLPGTNRLGAAVLAERVRAAVERAMIRAGGTRLPLTVSLGVASLGHDVGGNLDDLLGIADRRLYLAKESGRNRICVNDEGHSTFA
jgi:two-component system, cell cycle response regulator